MSTKFLIVVIACCVLAMIALTPPAVKAEKERHKQAIREVLQEKCK